MGRTEVTKERSNELDDRTMKIIQLKQKNNT